MPTSAERRGEQGFTLLEVMVTVLLLSTVMLPILQLREIATRKAYKASRMVSALNHAQQLLADSVFELRELDGQEGEIEEDPSFRYSITLKEYDLATGLNVNDSGLDDDVYDDYEQGLLPGDAGVPPEDEDEERGNPHLVRRYEISVSWVSWDSPTSTDDEADDDEEQARDEVTIEGFLPRVFEREQDTDEEDGGP